MIGNIRRFEPFGEAPIRVIDDDGRWVAPFACDLDEARLRAIYRDMLRARRFDVVHVHTPFAAHYEGRWLARALDLPLVETYHTYFEEYLDKYLPWLPRQALRYAARRFSRSQCGEVDALVVPTRPMLQVLRDYGVDKPAEVIPTGIPAGAFSGGDGNRFRRRHGIGPERRIMLYVGRVAHEKNIDFLLQVVDRVRQTHPQVLLVIAGEGPATKHLQRLGESMRLDRHLGFVGYLSREQDLPDCYAAGDVFAFASRTETQGLVLLEAMQAGTPVVSTAVMGTAEVMADRRGGLVAQERLDDFAEKVRQLFDDAALAARLREEAIEKAAEWSAPATAERLAALYAQCVEARVQRVPLASRSG